MKTLVLAGVAVALGLAALGAVDHISASQPAAEIMFVRDNAAHGGDIFVAARDASRERLLVANAGAPTASHDGRRIAFARDGYVWTARRDGSAQRRLVRGSSPAIAADGSVWFTRYVERHVASREGNEYGDDWAVALFRSSSGRISLVAGKPAYKGVCIGSPVLSPNEQLVAYTNAYDECVNGLYWRVGVVGRDGAQTTLGIPNNAHSPSWSPDGTRLLYVTVDDYGDRNGVSVARVDGSGARGILNRLAWGPTWSPDGKWIAMNFSKDIWLMRPDGSDLHRLDKPGTREHSPAWLPPTP